MAALTDIAIHLSYLDWPGDELRLRRAFVRSAGLAGGIFRSFMPRLVVDGRGKLNIFLGDREPVRRYEPQEARIGSLSEYSPGAFDLPAFLEQEPALRFAACLDLIEDALVDICTACDVDPQPYREAAARARATNGELDMEIPLSRSTRDRRLRFRVMRLLNESIEGWRVELVERNGRIATTCVIAADLQAMSCYEFCSSKVVDEAFTLFDFQHRPVFSVSREGEVLLPFVPARYSVKSS